MMNLRPYLFVTALVLFSANPSWSEEAKDTNSEETKTEESTTSEEATQKDGAADAPEQTTDAQAADGEATNEGQQASTEDEAETVAAPPTESGPAEETPEPESEPNTDTPAAAAPAPAPTSEMDEPSASESATIAWIFAGVTLASVAGGVYAGLEAQTQFDCLSDIINCNEGRDTPIENEDYLKAKADLDRLVLLADMGYLTAVVTTTVTIAAVVKAMSGDDPSETTAATSMLSMPQE